MAADPPFELEAGRRRQYLRRLGFTAAPAPDRAGLRALHRAHLRSFPFENLDIHLGRRIELDGDRISAKLLDEHRGGYCYELNGAFASLLVSLGFEASLLEARVYEGDDVGIRYDHACVRVALDDPHLADVGFGACFLEPIELRPGVDQHDPAGVYRLEDRGDGWLDLLGDGQRQYRLSLTPRALGEFAEGNVHQQTSPSSPFTKNTICSIATEHGRVTVRGSRLIETIGTERVERDLASDELAAVLADRFGIELDDDEVSALVG